MNRRIGIFRKQEQAIEAVQTLENQGFGPADLKVIAKNREHTERVAAETDVHTDELMELADNGDHDRSGLLPGTRIPLLGLVGLGTFGGAGGIAGSGAGYPPGAGASPVLGAGLLATGALEGVPDEDGNQGMRSALQSLGMNDEEVDVVGDAIRDGSLAVVAEAASTDDRRLYMAEDAFHRAGAARVL